jgi:hypothetical protein
MIKPATPFPDSYWVVDGKFLAGEYPSNRDDAKAVEKIRRLLGCGVNSIVDLTEAGEYDLRNYQMMLAVEALRLGMDVRHTRMDFADGSVPSAGHVRRVLDFIAAEIAAGRVVYVHCFGGIGRTGTIVGCWLAEHGHAGAKAIQVIAEWRAGTPDGHRESPENGGQKRFVEAWPPRGATPSDA